MVDDHGGGQRGDEVVQLRQLRGLEIDHHMPAQLRDAGGNFYQFIARGGVYQPLHEVEAHATHTGGVHGGELCIGNGAAHCGYAAGEAIRTTNGIYHGAVVRAVASGLHHYVTGKA